MKQNSVIITGASDGIGKAMAHAFARRGFELGLMARRAALLETVAEQCRKLGAPRVEVMVSDVSEFDDFRNRLAQLDDKLGGAEYFIANAGINLECPVDADGSAMAARTVDVNVTGAIVGCELMKTRMLRRGHGCIAGVGSVAGVRGLPVAAHYCASKAALRVYLEGLKIDTHGRGLDVCLIAPGFVETEMTKGGDYSRPFMTDATGAGEIFVRDVIKRRWLIIAPWQFRFFYFVLKHLPDRIYFGVVARIFRRMKQ